MKRPGIFVAVFGAAFSLAAQVTIDYPENGSIFPPEITSPAFIWRDAAQGATEWSIEIAFSDGAAGVSAKVKGKRLPIGEIDPRTVAETNEPPKLTPLQAAAWTWTPDEETWGEIKRRSRERPAVITITAIGGQGLSRGPVTIQTSKDPVGAPIFYRDVPLMPTETEKGVIKPLVPSAVPLVSWRLRYVGEPRSRLLMEGLPTCANCHSFSADGKTMGLDVDGPQNDKGMYALVDLAPQTLIRNQDVFSWNSFPNKPTGHRTIGYMAQVSPDGRFAVTTVNEGMYVANFKDYRFLQVFYPTRGILAWYERTTGRMRSLPGADNPAFVQTNGFWSPDGKHLVFARAVAKEPYPEGRKLAAFANDPNEPPIRYDLYTIPFNGGKGGRAKQVAGASRSGKSSSFPRISPDGRWIVYVQSNNGQLMRPDGQLFIVPFEGGAARRMRCNTPLMNSWHSFSPNGRWMVFSSKSRSPYTQMFLTHIDENGNDSPPILIDNSTAANRAVNIPEFVNVPPGGLEKISVPAAEFYRLFDSAWRLAEKGAYEAAIGEWKKALALNPEDAKANNNLGIVLLRTGGLDDAVARFRKAVAIKPDYAEALSNLGVALTQQGRPGEAVVHFEKALEFSPGAAPVHNNLGRVLAAQGKLDKAIAHHRKALELNPNYAEAHNDLAAGLHRKGRSEEAIQHWRTAVALNPRFVEARINLTEALKGRISRELREQ